MLVVLKSKVGYWKELADAAEAAAKVAGATVVVRSPPTEESSGAQVRLLELALKEQKFDALIIAAINPSATLPILQDVRSRGIRVVALDAPQPDYDADCYVISGNQAVNESIAELAKSLDQKGEVIAFRQAQLAGPRQRRELAVLNSLGQFKDLKIYSDIYLDTNVAESETKIEFALSKHPGCRALVTTSSLSALATLRVSEKEAHRGKLKIVGVGYRLPGEAVKAFKNGSLVAWAVEPSEPIGKRALECAVDLCSGRTVTQVVETESFMVTAADIDHADVQRRIDPIKE